MKQPAGKRAEAGAAMVEYALTALIFCTLFLFLMDGSRILWHYVTVAEAARVGARYAATHGAQSPAPVGPAGYTALRNEVLNRTTGLTGANLTITATWNPNNQRGSRVTVDVTYNVSTLSSLFWAGRTITLRSRASAVIVN